ncbi:unnamed protein product [Amoebophrya sp. A120]|nr:unnamed protein product [Amoebophrya sp. A120]|eukprot:GSA120T00009726001.1
MGQAQSSSTISTCPTTTTASTTTSSQGGAQQQPTATLPPHSVIIVESPMQRNLALIQGIISASLYQSGEFNELRENTKLTFQVEFKDRALPENRPLCEAALGTRSSSSGAGVVDQAATPGGVVMNYNSIDDPKKYPVVFLYTFCPPAAANSDAGAPTSAASTGGGGSGPGCFMYHPYVASDPTERMLLHQAIERRVKDILCREPHSFAVNANFAARVNLVCVDGGVSDKLCVTETITVQKFG